MKRQIRVGWYILLILAMLLSGCNFGAILSGNVPSTVSTSFGTVSTVPQPTTTLPVGTTEHTVVTISKTTTTVPLGTTAPTVPTAPPVTTVPLGTTVPTVPPETTAPTEPTIPSKPTVPEQPSVPTRPTEPYYPPMPPTPTEPFVDYVLHISLTDGDEIFVEYGGEYSDPGVKAWLTVGDTLDIAREVTDITVQGQVDMQTIGSYVVMYTVTYDNMGTLL